MDRPEHKDLKVTIDPDLDTVTILARYWDERLPDAYNIETISWWLRQTSGKKVSPARGGQ